jgi:hypothetical protein
MLEEKKDSKEVRRKNRVKEGAPFDDLINISEVNPQ